MTTKNEQRELNFAQYILDLEGQYNVICYQSRNLASHWLSVIQQMYQAQTEAMRLFDKLLYGVGHVLLDDENGCQPQVQFNRQYGAVWIKLSKQSALWETLAGILYKKALLRDNLKPGMELNEIVDELAKAVQQQYGELSDYYKLIDAYRVRLSFFNPIIDEPDAI